MELSPKKLVIALLLVFVLGVLFAVVNGSYAVSEGSSLPVIVYIISLVSLAIGAAIVILFQWKINESQLKRVLKILPADERIVVDILLRNKNELEQNRLVAQTGLGKVKTSRILARLEQRGIVKKTHMGNTNLVRLDI